MDSLQTKAHRACPANLSSLRQLCEQQAGRVIQPNRIGTRQTLSGARRQWAEIALSEAVSVKHAAEAFRMRQNTVTRHRCVRRDWRDECRAFAATLPVEWERFSVRRAA